MKYRSNLIALVYIIALVLIFTGCASLPPSTNTLSGKRLAVTVHFRSPVNAFNHYFFLINSANNQNAAGPVPVVIPPYGNGFATGVAGASGFTDFIRFDNQQPQGYGLYHVIGDANRSNFVLEGRPVSFTIPDSNDPRTANTLTFEIDLSQLITDANGAPLADQTQAATLAKALRWLQVNIVATDQIPKDVVTQINKQVDAMGDSRSQNSASAFLLLDLSQNRTISNTDFIGQSIEEPTDIDVFGGNDPTLDITDWSITVRQQ